ncbi:MAG: hypothetical protein J2P17_34280 [Mycobacterium sp.]|nr:hypothetical protein [Mycobacterium sp.]
MTELADGDVQLVRRTTELPVRNLKADRPRTVTLRFLGDLSHINWRENVADQLADHKQLGSKRAACSTTITATKSGRALPGHAG